MACYFSPPSILRMHASRCRAMKDHSYALRSGKAVQDSEKNPSFPCHILMNLGNVVVR